MSAHARESFRAIANGELVRGFRPSATHENEAGKQVSFPPHGDHILISLYVEWTHFHGKTPMLYFGKHASLEKIAFIYYDVIHR